MGGKVVVAYSALQRAHRHGQRTSRWRIIHLQLVYQTQVQIQTPRRLYLRHLGSRNAAVQSNARIHLLSLPIGEANGRDSVH